MTYLSILMPNNIMSKVNLNKRRRRSKSSIVSLVLSNKRVRRISVRLTITKDHFVRVNRSI